MKSPDPDKLNALLGKLVGDLGAAAGASLVLLGDRLGIYKAMADGKAVTPEELDEKTKLNARYLREWLSAQAADGYIDYNAKSKKFKLNPELPLPRHREVLPPRLQSPSRLGVDSVAARCERQAGERCERRRRRLRPWRIDDPDGARLPQV